MCIWQVYIRCYTLQDWAEYRTLPMVWYVPPLSPILQRVTSDVYLPDAHEMRVPVQYLANLLQHGNTDILARTLQRVLDMREIHAPS